jgi:hypothetical protein
LILYLNSATLFEYSIFILCFIFSRKKSGSEPSIFEPLVVENCWPTKRARQNGRRRQISVQDIVVQTDSVVDVQVQTESFLNDVVQTESILDDVVQTESILDEVVQLNPFWMKWCKLNPFWMLWCKLELNLSC